MEIETSAPAGGVEDRRLRDSITASMPRLLRPNVSNLFFKFQHCIPFCVCIIVLSSPIYAPYLFTYFNSYAGTVLYSPSLLINCSGFIY
jgi:hypothetical protein